MCKDCIALVAFARESINAQEFLSSIYFATDYNEPFVRNLIQKLKYKPFAKELAQPLALLIITYFKNLEKQPFFLRPENGFSIIPIPLFSKRLKWRGFNQSEEIAKILAGYFEMPFLQDALLRIKNTIPQIELPKKGRDENIKDAFACPRPKEIRNKNIILFDDVYTTGATMREAAKALKRAGAKQIVGLTVARR